LLGSERWRLLLGRELRRLLLCRLLLWRKRRRLPLSRLGEPLGWMLASVQVLRRLLLRGRPLDPGRRSRRSIVGFQRLLRTWLRRLWPRLWWWLELIARIATRLNRLIRAATKPRERIGLADQPRKFGERIALAS
jgi:hypothetical protein